MSKHNEILRENVGYMTIGKMRILGTLKTGAAAETHERADQYFKRH